MLILIAHDVPWFWENLHVHEFDDTIDYSQRSKPLMQHWTKEKAMNVATVFEKHGLGVGQAT